MNLCRKKIVVAMQASKRRSSATAASSTSQYSLGVTRRPSTMVAKIWLSCQRTRLKAASEKKGGRKKASIACPDVKENLLEIVRDNTAGDPMQEEAIWTYLSAPEIAEQLEAL